VDLRSAWEANADAWVAWCRRPGLDTYRYHRDQFLELLPAPGELTLDVGCGEGRLARDMTARGHRVIAIDGSPTMIAAATAAAPELEYHVADASDLPVATAAADLAVAFMLLHDVDDLDGAVRELGRVVRPGGRLAIAFVHPHGTAGDAYLERTRYVRDVTEGGLTMTFHSRHRPLEDYFAALAAAGFVTETLREPAAPEDENPHYRRNPLFLHLSARRS
jgi:ubiquinone/menaquinone biosynthesis C-methylase UbiE